MQLLPYLLLLFVITMFRSAAFVFRSQLSNRKQILWSTTTTSYNILKHRLNTKSFHTGTSANRKGIATVAALLTTTSVTVLATAGSNFENNIQSSTLDRSFQSTTTTKITNCEGQPSNNSKEEEKDDDTMIPEYLLKFDHYNGVIIHLDWISNQTISTSGNEKDDTAENSKMQEELRQKYREWNQNPEKFEALLQKSLQKWSEEGRKGIWIHMPRCMANLVPACINLGFDFHSCQSKNQINAGAKTGTTHLVLSKWLPTDSVSRLPLGPYFQAGVGCVVLHPEDPSKMLVVQEMTGPAAARKLWKMPTGLIDPDEDIAEAALRELEEETGLHGAKCEGILTFRQAHGTTPGRAFSDLFFVCLLSVPTTSQQQSSDGSEKKTSLDNLKPQEGEIADIRWMPVEEFADQELWQMSPVYQELNQPILDAVKQIQEGKPIPMFVPSQLPLGFSKGSNTVYRSHL